MQVIMTVHPRGDYLNKMGEGKAQGHHLKYMREDKSRRTEVVTVNSEWRI